MPKVCRSVRCTSSVVVSSASEALNGTSLPHAFVMTHDTLNRLRKTVVVIPLSTAAQPHPPITVPLSCRGRPAVAITDQVRAISKQRLKTRIETASADALKDVSEAPATILAVR